MEALTQGAGANPGVVVFRAKEMRRGGRQALVRSIQLAIADNRAAHAYALTRLLVKVCRRYHNLQCP